ncbi:MAG: zinc-ribbon domain-containing protein [Bacillota bacterium]
MFCPFCGRQNKDNAVFCEYCGKAIPKKNSILESQSFAQANQPTKVKKQKAGLSYNAKRGIVTGILLVVLILVVLVIYYPNVFPWNW